MSLVGEAVVRVRADATGVPQQAAAAGATAGKAYAGGFNKHAAGATTQARKELAQVERGALAGSAAFSHLGRSLAFASGAFLGTAKAVDILRTSIKDAADTQKQLERGAKEFGPAFASVKKFADDAAKSLGLSSSQALTFTNNVGQMLTSLKLGPTQTAEFSKQLVSLAANLASVRNEDPAAVFAKLNAALRGRGAALRTYGIDISQAAIKEEALRLGLVKASVDESKVQNARINLAAATANLQKVSSEHARNTVAYAKAYQAATNAQNALNKAVAGGIPQLTASQKQLATVNLILQQGAKYQGEFAAHSDDLANKQRVLSAEIANLKSKLGDALLPTVSQITSAMVEWLDKEKNQEKITSAIKEGVHDLNIVLSTTWDILKKVNAVLGPVVKVFGGWHDAIKLLLTLKIASWVSGLVTGVFTSLRVKIEEIVLWFGRLGGSATTAATEVGVAATSMEASMSRLGTSTATSSVTKSIGGIGSAAQTSQSKVGKLSGGLSKLGELGKIAIPVAIAMSVTNSKGNVFADTIQNAVIGFMFGGPEGAIAAGAVPIVRQLIIEGIFQNPLFGGSRSDITSTNLGAVRNANVAGLRAPVNVGDQAILTSEGKLIVMSAQGIPVLVTQAQMAKLLGITAARLRQLIASSTPASTFANAIPLSPGGLLPGVLTSPGGAFTSTRGAPPRSFAGRVGAETPGLAALQAFLTGAGGQAGSPAINFSGHGKQTGVSFHYSGEALDIGDGGRPQSLVATWNLLVAHVTEFAELFWDYGGYYKWGQRIGAPGSNRVSGHKDHIHVAFTGSPEEIRRVFRIQTPSGGGRPGGVGQVTAGEFAAVSQATGLPVALLMALIKQESGGIQGAVSKAGARGVAQLMAPSALAAQNTPAGRRANLLQGAQQLAGYIQEFGSVELGLIAYNAGPNYLRNLLKRSGGIITRAQLPKETQGFLSNILGGAGGGGNVFAPPTTPLVVDSLKKQRQGSILAFLDAVFKGQPSLADQLAAAERGITRAQASGNAEKLADAIAAQIGVDQATIKRAGEVLAARGKKATAEQRKQIHDLINQRKGDIENLRAQLVTAQRQEAAQFAKEQQHMRLVDQVIRMLFPDEATSSRAMELLEAHFKKFSDSVLNAMRRAHAQLVARIRALNAQLRTASTEGTSVLGTLGGFDPDLKISFTDKFGRVFTESMTEVIAKGRVLWARLQAAMRSGSEAAKKAALAAWNNFGSELSAAVGAGQDAATAALEKARSAFETAFDRVSSRLLEGFDRQTQEGLAAMQDSLNNQVNELNNQLTAQIAEIQRKAALLTPAERLLANLQKRQATTGLARSKTDADQSLQNARATFQQLSALGVGAVGPGGNVITQADIQAASDQMVQAQRSLDDALLQERIMSVEEKAAKERKIVDENAQHEIEAAQKVTEAKIAGLQREEAAREREYNDQRSVERQQLQDSLDDWKAKIESGKASWSDFVNWLGTQDVNSAIAGGNLGKAFADAYIAELGRAHDAQVILAQGGDPRSVASVTTTPSRSTHHVGSTPVGTLGGPGGVPQFAAGGTYTGRDDRFVLAQGGETVIDRQLTNALRQIFLGGQGGFDTKTLADLLMASLMEQKKQTGLLGQPTVVAVPTENANALAYKAVR